MSIAALDKVTIIGHHNNKEEVLAGLQALQAELLRQRFLMRQKLPSKTKLNWISVMLVPALKTLKSQTWK